MVDHIIASLEPDIEYRIAHHEDLDHRPPVTVIEVTEGAVELPDGQGGKVAITCGQTDHKPVEPSVGFRFDFEGASVVAAGDTVPCDGLDALCAGADAVVHTVIRKDIIANIPMQRMQDTLDYHSSPEEAAQTAREGRPVDADPHALRPADAAGRHRGRLARPRRRTLRRHDRTRRRPPPRRHPPP